jgi:hypothetical protein
MWIGISLWIKQFFICAQRSKRTLITGLSILISPSVFSSVCYNKCENTHLLLITEMQKSTQIWGPLRESLASCRWKSMYQLLTENTALQVFLDFPLLNIFIWANYYILYIILYLKHRRKKQNLFTVSYVDPFADIYLDKNILVTILLKSRKHYTGRHIFGCLSWTWDQSTIYQ